MPPGTSSSKPPTLIIGESAEAAYRYAGSDEADVELVVATSDGAVEVVGDTFGRAVVVGFASSPDRLRTIVDQAFDLVGVDGRVLVGSAVGAVEPDTAAWDFAFAGLRVVSADRGAFPSVELARDPQGVAGAYVLGALSVLALTAPRPAVSAPAEPAPKPPAVAKTAKPSAPAPSRRQQLVGLARSHAKLLAAAAVAFAVALAVSVGLVALLGKYFIAMAVTSTLLIVLGLVLLQERRSREIRHQLAQAASGQSAFRTKVLDQLRGQRKDLDQMQKAVGVSQLAIVEAGRTLERLEDQRRP